MATDFPTNLSTGTVTGRFILASADSVDGGTDPDVVAAVGTVVFTPSPQVIKDPTSTPAPLMLMPAPITATLDSEGYICGVGTTRGVTLIATDDADVTPVNWTWSVKFNLTANGGTALTLDSFSFQLPSGTTKDITALAPVPASNGTYYTQGPAGPSSQLPLVSGEFYRSSQTWVQNSAPNNGDMGLHPVYIGAAATLNQIAILSAGFTSSGNVRMGIYSDLNGKPNTLLLDAGTVTVAAGSTAYPITITQALTAGWYWLAGVKQTGTFGVWSAGGGSSPASNLGIYRMATANSSALSAPNMQITGVTGALPSTATAATYINAGTALPAPYIRIA
jgi:hypothetical protein